MSGAAHNGADDVAFYEADIGYTYELSVTDLGVQMDADLGAMPPGRYLIQAFNLTAGAVCWVTTGPAGSTLSLGTGAGRRRIPLTNSTILAIETNARNGHSDKVGAICSAGGTATLWITLVSTKTGNN